MRRRRHPLPAPEPHLMAHLRTTVWGPAEFVGLPPWRLTAAGVLTGLLGAGAITGTALVGAWYGVPGLSGGEAPLVCVAALTVRLFAVRAGRALIGVVTVLGVCLALQAPQAAAGLVLAERGRVESAVVMAVEGGPGAVSAGGRYLCSVTGPGGVALKVRIWRGCGPATRPGDVLAVVHDVRGLVPPRGVRTGAEPGGLVGDLGGWAAALVTACAVAVARSYRMSRTAAPVRPAATGPGHGGITGTTSG